LDEITSSINGSNVAKGHEIVEVKDSEMIDGTGKDEDGEELVPVEDPDVMASVSPHDLRAQYARLDREQSNDRTSKRRKGEEGTVLKESALDHFINPPMPNKCRRSSAMVYFGNDLAGEKSCCCCCYGLTADQALWTMRIVTQQHQVAVRVVILNRLRSAAISATQASSASLTSTLTLSLLSLVDLPSNPS
jgi:hypothetical protein